MGAYVSVRRRLDLLKWNGRDEIPESAKRVSIEVKWELRRQRTNMHPP